MCKIDLSQEDGVKDDISVDRLEEVVLFSQICSHIFMQVLASVTIIEKENPLFGNCSVGHDTAVHQQITVKLNSKKKSLFKNGKLSQKLGERHTSKKMKKLVHRIPKFHLQGSKA